MTDFATNSTHIAAGTLFALGNADRLFVGPDGMLISTAGTAVTSGFGSAIIIAGSVYGAYNGISLGNAVVPSEGNASLTVLEGGIVSGAPGGGPGVYMVNPGDSVLNAGTISGIIAIQTAGVESFRVTGGMINNSGDLVGEDAGIWGDYFTGRIINSGRILSSDYSFLAYGSVIGNVNGGIIITRGEANIENSGLISSTSYYGYGIAVHGGNSSIINSGEIKTATSSADRGAISMYTTADQASEFTNLAGGRVTSLATAVLGGDGIDTVVNRGELVGDVLLDGSDDRFDGRTGVILGLISGDDGDDWIRGGGVNNDIDGGRGNDNLAGNAGEDTIRGGRGRDILYGGDDADVFVYANVLDSQVGGLKRDVIRDFVHKLDTIDLSAVDADKTLGGNQAFTFIGSDPFSAPGQARYDSTTGVVSMNTDADLAADMQISLTGKPVVTAADFIL